MPDDNSKDASLGMQRASKCSVQAHNDLIYEGDSGPWQVQKQAPRRPFFGEERGAGK